MMNKKLRSPSQVGETNTMDSFQDGGQQNMNSTQNDFMEGSHLNADMNSYPPSSIGMEGYGRMNQNVHPSQMQGYSPYNRENFNPGDQHGGTTGSSDYMNQNASFQGQYPRQGMPVGMKPGMRAGMGNPGGPMLTPYQQRMSGQSISQQSGPTPTLNQLLQTQSTSSTSQRMQPNNYSEYPQKGMNDINSSAYNMQQPWAGHQRPMGYHPGSMNSPGPAFRGQNMSEMNQPRPGYTPSNYQMPPQSQYSAGQFSPNSRYGNMGALNRAGPANMPNTGFGHPNPQMSSGQPPGMTPPPSGGMASPMPNDSPHHRQASPSPLRRQPTPTSRSSSPQNTPSGAQQQQPSPSGSSSSWSGVNANGSKKNAEDGDMDLSGCDDVASCDNNSQGLPTSNSPHPSISSLRPIPSPVGSSGSRSNTPASLPGTQAGSPMPPRPPSQHDSNPSSRMTQSPMATSYNQQMMPPPMGPNQVNYGPGGGKMAGNMPGPMNQGFPQYNSHYPQGNYSGRPGMPQAGGVMQNYQMYNGPTPGAPSGGAPNMYNNMPMNRNSNYNPYGGQPNNMMGGMSNYNSGMPDMANGPRPPTPGTPGSGASNSKSAKAAAQAALIAAASQQRAQQPSGRSNIPPAQVMYGQGGPHPGYPGGMTNSHSPVPNSVGPNSLMPNCSSAPNMSDSSVTHNSLPPSQDSGNPQSNGPPSNSYGSPSSVSSTNEKMPSQQNIPPSKKQNMQRDSSISSSSNDNVTSSSEMTASNNNDSSSVPPQSGSMDSKDLQSGTPPNQGLPPESLGADSNLSSLTDTSSQGGDLLCNEQKDVEMPCMPDQSNLPPNAMKQEMPITTTATTNTMEKNIVTQVNTCPVMSTTEVSSDGHGHIPANPQQQQPAPPNPMPVLEESVPDKKKKEGVSSHPPTPASLVAPSPGSASVSSFHEEFDNITSPPVGSNWANQTKGGDVNKLYEMGSEPERRYFLNRLLSFLEERNAPLNNMPSISKQPLDLYRLYLHVQEKGGMVEVTKAKKWKEICGLINIGSSASAAFTLKKNYIKYLFHYECQFERGGMDPGPILAHMEAQLAQKRESKKSRAPSPGKKEKAGSQGSQDAFRPPSNSNANQGMEGFPGNMPNQGYDPNMGPMMPGMMPQGQMMNNMMPPNSMGGMGHQMMHPGMMGNNYNMRPGMMNPNMMPHNNMMGMPPGGNMGMSQNNMGMPGNNMGMQGGGVRMPHGNNMGMPNSSMGGMNSGNNMGMPPQNNIGMGHGNSMGMPPGNNMGMPPQNNMGMGPGNNMAVPPSGNHMPMSSSSRGNLPPSSTNQVIPPVNGDSISCQDPFADDMNNSGFINSGQQNSQGSNYSGLPPNNSAGNFKPNMPPNSMAQNVPSSTISQTSTPLNSSIQSHNSMGPSMLPNNMGPNSTPSSMSPMLSGSGGASNVPPNSMGQPMPPSSMSQSMPPNSSGTGQPLPPSSIGQSMPPSSAGQPMPPSSMGQQMPPTSVGHSMPPNSMGPSAPASSMDLSSVPQNSSHGIMTQNSLSQNLPSNVSMGMPPSSVPQTFNTNMGQCGPPSSVGQNMPPNSSSQSMPNFQPNMENPMSAFPPESSIPFSNYQGNNSQDGDLSQGSTSNMSTPSLSSGRNFPFGENQFNKPERFDSPNPVQSVTPTPTPPPQRQPTPQSSAPLQQQQPPTPLQPPPPQDATFSQNRYGNQPPSMMPQGPQPHMGGGGGGGPPHDPYTHNFPHQQGFNTPNKMMGGPSEQYGGFQSQYQNFPNQRPPMRNEMGMYGTPSKRFPDQYPNQAGYNSQPPPSSGYGSQHCNTQSSGFNSSSSGMMGYNTPPSSYADGSHQSSYMGYNSQPSSYGDGSYRDTMSFDSQDSRPNNQWSPMQRYGHVPHSMGMSPAPGLPPHMAPSPYQRGHNRMSPTPSHKQGPYMSPPKMKMPPNQIPKKEIPFPHDSVEATTPNYFKRRRLTRSDVGPIEAWRVMMGLKSGLLAESTWALDTLNILLYDDATVQYFNLAHLPGMLEALLEHFRKSLISIFGDMFEEMEKMSDEADEIPNKHMINIKMEEKVAVSGDEFTNYTYISRKGKEVKMEDNNHKGVSPLDSKEWDIYSGYSYKYGHWQLGGGDLSSHIVPCFGSSNESKVYRRMYFRPPMELKNEVNISEEKNFVDTEKSKDLKLEEDRKVDDQAEVDDQKENDSQVEVEDKTDMEGQKEMDGQVEVKDSIKVKEEEHVKNHVIKKVKIKEEPIEEDDKQQDSKEDKNCDLENKESNGCDDEKMDESIEEKSDVKSENVKTEIDSDDSVIKQESDTEKCQTEQVCSKRKREIEQEDEAYQKDEPPLRLISDMQEELGRRCVCISNIFRSLSSIPSNHLEFSKHPGLMYTLGKLLKLNHRHLPRNTTRKKFDRDDSELEDISDSHLQQNDEEWWWEYFSMLRENTLVIFANICGHLELKYYPEEICMPILDGLLHWAVCPSSCATDPLPSTTTSVLSPQRLVLEALSKLCIHETNVDLLLATPPFDRIVQLFSILTKLLANKSEQVTLEFALVLLSSLVQGDTSCARAVAMQHPSISLLLDFLETAEHKAMTVANHHGINALRENPEIMGTSLDMLRRAANILLNLASVPENRSLFTQHQQRLLSLVMSQILDQFVAQILSDVLYQCFQDDLPSS